MAVYDSMHIFGFGLSQMVGPVKNGKVASNTLTTLAPLLTYLASQQQTGTDISEVTLHALNVINNGGSGFIDFLPKDVTGNLHQRFMMADIDMTTVDNFADELAEAL